MHQERWKTFHWDIVASMFYLPAIHNFLIKDSKLIADSISICCQAQGCHWVQEASCIKREIKLSIITSPLLILRSAHLKTLSSPASRPSPPLPRPASSSMSCSSSISSPSWEETEYERKRDRRRYITSESTKHALLPGFIFHQTYISRHSQHSSAHLEWFAFNFLIRIKEPGATDLRLAVLQCTQL